MTNVGEQEKGADRREGGLESRRRCSALHRRIARFATAFGRSVAGALRPLIGRSPAGHGPRGVRTAGMGMGGDALPQGPVPVAALPARGPGGADPGGPPGATAKRSPRKSFGDERRGVNCASSPVGRDEPRDGLALDAGLWAALRRGADSLLIARRRGAGPPAPSARGSNGTTLRAIGGVCGRPGPGSAAAPSPGGSRERRKVCTFALAGIVRKSVQFLTLKRHFGQPNAGSGHRGEPASVSNSLPNDTSRRVTRFAEILRRKGGKTLCGLPIAICVLATAFAEVVAGQNLKNYDPFSLVEVSYSFTAYGKEYEGDVSLDGSGTAVGTSISKSISLSENPLFLAGSAGFSRINGSLDISEGATNAKFRSNVLSGYVRAGYEGRGDRHRMFYGLFGYGHVSGLSTTVEGRRRIEADDSDRRVYGAGALGQVTERYMIDLSFTRVDDLDDEISSSNTFSVSNVFLIENGIAVSAGGGYTSGGDAGDLMMNVRLVWMFE